MSDVLVSGQELQSAPVARRARLPVSVVVGGVFLVSMVACALVGRWIATHDPDAQDLLVGLAGPSTDHWLGTDELGRDIFSRLVVGARPALQGPMIIAVGAMLAGCILGMAAGYMGGLVDTFVSRWVDVMFSLPGLLVAIVVVGVLGGGYWIAVLVLIVLTAPYNARLVRGATLEQRPRPYIEAARVLGLTRRRIMFAEILPNIVPLIVAATVLNFAFAIVSLSGLSFLGLGVPPGTADWGRMLAESRVLLFENPMTAVGPGLAIVLTALSVNLLGDWIYELLLERGRMR